MNETMGRYGGYTAEEFDRQYNPRLWTPNSEALVARNEELSASLRKRANCSLDISWGPKASNGVDLFFPEQVDGQSSWPVVLFIHGGYWRSRQKSSFSFVSQPLLDAGAMVAVTDYSLCPDVRLQDIVEEMRVLVEWLYHNIEKYAGRRTLHVVGHSAGGHLAAMLALTDWQSRGTGVAPDFIRSIIPISGVFELEPLLSHSVNDDLKLRPDDIESLSPSRFDAHSVKALAKVYVGTDESDEFQRQSREFAEKWLSMGVKVRYTELEGHDHYSILSALADPEYRITRDLIECLSV